MTEQQQEQDMSDDEALMKLAQAMKDNAPNQDEKHNAHSFLVSVVQEDDVDKIKKTSNLRNDKDLDELGVPAWTVRGAAEMVQISRMIMGNDYFAEFFENSLKDIATTSLSREGFIVRQGTTQTKQIADVTRRRKINKGMFGQRKIEETGGDSFSSGNTG